VRDLPLNMFIGKPCRKCGLNVRYNSSGKCVACRQNSLKAQSAVHPRNSLHAKLGITKQKYYSLLEDQGWACAICCRTPKTKLVVDHCHKTGRFRGMLCMGCNTALGKFKDSPKLLSRAIEYLKSEGEE